jgi:signal transduction histidine kinase
LAEKALQTRFAPSERSTQEEIGSQSGLLSGDPFFLGALDLLQEAVIILNRNRQILFSNKAFFRLAAGEESHDLAGLRPGEALRCGNAYRTETGCGTTQHCSVCGFVKSILASQEGKDRVQECRITRKDNGEALDLRIFSSPFLYKGHPYTIHTVRDISHEKRRSALEQLFFHDILNTAGSLRGMAEYLRDYGAKDEEEFIENIHDVSQQLIHEIEAQKELTLAENNELPVHPFPFSTTEMLRRVAEQYKTHEMNKEHEILVASDSAEVVMTSDWNLLSRVLGNMVKNAIEASDPGSRITLGCDADREEVRFRVHNPKVMPSEVQLQVFQRSFSTKGVGRGLGTYSMRLLTERYLKGSVSFTSSPGQGTTFTAAYPLFLEEE